MTAITATHYFDTLEYVRKAKEIKNPEALAEYQVKQMETAIGTLAQQVKEEMNQVRDDVIHKEKELATKKDLDILAGQTKKEIELSESRLLLKLEKEIAQVNQNIVQLRYETLKFIVWTGVGAVVVLSGLLARGFHWF